MGNTNLKILVADDLAAMRQTLRKSLNFWFSNIVGAEDGIDALERLKEGDFDLVIADIQDERLGAA